MVFFRKLKNDIYGGSNAKLLIGCLVFMYLFFSVASKILDLIYNAVENDAFGIFLGFITLWVAISIVVLVVGIRNHFKTERDAVALKKFLLKCGVNYVLIIITVFLSGICSDCSVKYMNQRYDDIKQDFVKLFPDKKEIADYFDGYEITEGNVHNSFVEDDITYYVVNNDFNRLTAEEMCEYFIKSELYDSVDFARYFYGDNLKDALCDKKSCYAYSRRPDRYGPDSYYYGGVICNDNKYSIVQINPNGINSYYAESNIFYINDEPVFKFNEYGIIEVSQTFTNNGCFNGDLECIEKTEEKNDNSSKSSVGSSSSSGSFLSPYSSKKASSSKNNNNYYDDDQYNVFDYDDPEDFYYDNEDDFEDYEDAEDYYYDARGE
jgi:hypothetical protein